MVSCAGSPTTGVASSNRAAIQTPQSISRRWLRPASVNNWQWATQSQNGVSQLPQQQVAQASRQANAVAESRTWKRWNVSINSNTTTSGKGTDSVEGQASTFIMLYPSKHSCRVCLIDLFTCASIMVQRWRQ